MKVSKTETVNNVQVKIDVEFERFTDDVADLLIFLGFEVPTQNAEIKNKDYDFSEALEYCLKSVKND